MWPNYGQNTYRRIVPQSVEAGVILTISQNPGDGGGWRNSYTWWGDGSRQNANWSGYKWPDGTTGHADPKDPTQTFDDYYAVPRSIRQGYQWNRNIFPSFYRNGYIHGADGIVPLDRVITITATIDLLDASGSLLSQATLLFHERDTYPPDPDIFKENITMDKLLTLGTGFIQSFNAIRATVSATPLYADGTGPASGYWVAASVVANLMVTPRKLEGI